MEKYNVEIWLDLRNIDFPSKTEMRTDSLRNFEIEAESAKDAVLKVYELIHCSVLEDK